MWVVWAANRKRKLSPGRLHKRYCALLNSAQLELFYCGSAELARVEHALLAAFSALPRADVLEAVQTMPHSGAGEARYVSEEMDVTQGKLAIGFFLPEPGLSGAVAFYHDLRRQCYV